ncbi:MAG: glycosyltransferase [Chthoniobacterales bacterium]|nr:glycosyltransferase [Chthoniobacterales bacterium]
MPLALPSLRFQPEFYSDGISRFHLPLFYDLVTLRQPARVVTLGFGDSQPHFTFCQALREQKSGGRCLTIRREVPDENAQDDEAWQKAIADSAEFYRDVATLIAGHPVTLASEQAEGSIGLLLLDDCDSYEILRAELRAWLPKMAPDGIVLQHGLDLRRPEPPRRAWAEIFRQKPTAESGAGIGLGVAALNDDTVATSPWLTRIFGPAEEREESAVLYRLSAARIEAQAHSAQALRDLAALSARQIWLESMLEDRWKAQETMDEQAEQVSALRRDRAKAQLVMDSQHEQLRQWLAEGETRKREVEKLRAEVKKQKQIIQSAKRACRNGGRCFHEGDHPKDRKPLAQRIAREIQRIPRNLGLRRKEMEGAKPSAESLGKGTPEESYDVWKREHEPGENTLAGQRQSASQWKAAPPVSLLLPVFDPPGKFLDALFASIAAQTAPNWEVCLVDGGSRRAETREIIDRWVAREPRIRLLRLPENLGVSENTNRALAMATGEFIACVDHDDLLALFAIYELTAAILRAPEADIFYSDEDRCDEDGRRHAPFFKPEWSPELLLSSMYIGHLTAYRRSLVDIVGNFRKEFDLSQDYDFALRATERASAIEHVPHVLYHWREHPASGSAGGKPEARLTNLAALGDAMRRRHLPAEIIEYPAANRARLQPSQWPRVSVIIPTDSPSRAQSCLEKLTDETGYPDLEIVIVTRSALVAELREANPAAAALVFVPYDKPFNFSDKCNAGAGAASGERLIFFNDDVESLQADWIQNLIEPLENPEVGAVAPKLLYESGKIQHAGLVVGVRGLVGTAFHQRPADSTEHFNMAQSLRNVSALSAACLAVRRNDFLRVGGFDAINTPIAHSDVDLCFKIRDTGLRCVYTPFATLRHAGHVSIAAGEKVPSQRDKASIYLLKRWAEFTTHDPYFPQNMRDWLYTDSLAPIRMQARGQPRAVAAAPDLLMVSHDLSLSGAPIMLWHAARWCRENGLFVVVISPNDGPLREKFYELDLPVIIDPLVAEGHESFAQFARDFDCVIVNSIRNKAVARALRHAPVPVVWWVHEPGSVGEHYLREDAELREALPLADLVLAPSECTAEIYRSWRSGPVKCLRNAIPDLGPAPRLEAGERPLRFLLLASIEPRKGQDIFVEAIASLPTHLQEKAEFQIAGRILDPEFWLKIDGVVATVKNVTMLGALAHQDAIDQMREADVIVCASRDEAMPVIVLEAMSLGKAVIATTVGGVAEMLTNNENALLVRPESPAALAQAMRRLLEDPGLIPPMAERARASYERQFTIDRLGRDFREFVNEAITLSASPRDKDNEVE